MEAAELRAQSAAARSMRDAFGGSASKASELNRGEDHDDEDSALGLTGA